MSGSERTSDVRDPLAPIKAGVGEAAPGTIGIDDRSMERLNPKIAGRPDLMGDRTSLTLSEVMVGMRENVFINIKTRSLSITADVEIPQGGANGVILAQGRRFGGWSLYLKEGKPTYCCNFLGLQHFTVSTRRRWRTGKATIRMNFDYDGGRRPCRFIERPSVTSEKRAGHAQRTLLLPSRIPASRNARQPGTLRFPAVEFSAPILRGK